MLKLTLDLSLNVLRALLAEYTNAAKTSSPIKTNIQLLALLRKRTAASRAAAAEFSAANRTDLKDKEEAQIAVLEEYAGGVEIIGEEEITRIVSDAIGKMRTEGQKVDTGTVLKCLLAPGGAFEGKPVEKGEVARVVKGMI